MHQVPPKTQARILSFDEVRAAVGEPTWALLAQLPGRALVAYQQKIARHLPEPSSRMRSLSIHEFMVAGLQTAGVKVASVGGRRVLATDMVTIQVRKVDASGRTSNIPTRAARLWNTQLNLPGLPENMRVTLGYRLNRDGTKVEDVQLIARDGASILWRESLNGGDQGQLPLAQVAPISVNQPSPAAKKMRVKREAAEARGVRKRNPKTGA